MSRVIKNNDGVAVVEGTPAASLVKDVDKFFASKPSERMAGENIAEARRIKTEDNTMFMGGSKDFNEKTGRVEPNFRASEKREPRGRKPSFKNLSAEEQAEITAIREKQMEERKLRAETRMAETQGTPRRNEARDKAESRRRRFFERRRSRKEAERSQNEQEATQGKFITTLGR